MAECCEELVLRMVRAFRRLFRFQQLAFEVGPLSHPHEDTIVLNPAVALLPSRIDEERHFFTAFSADAHVNFFDLALELQEREEVRLVENPCARRKDRL